MQYDFNAAEARAAILEPLTCIDGRESLPVRDVLGRVLADDVIAPGNVPAHDNSAMDGYAVRFDDLSATDESAFKVVGSAFAGHPFSGQIGAGQAVRIMTGATIPAGADTIVPQENTRSEDTQVYIPAGQRRGQNLRRAGEDLAQGGIALGAGTRCGPAEIGLLASLGIAEVAVVRRLRVAFFSTGDEIASIGRPLGPGEIYDSNRYTLYGMLTALGCELLDMGVIPDRPEALEAAFREASENADVILTSGGVSVGEADYIRELVNRLGSVSFWRIAIKPGRPMAFGRIGKAWMFGLPGNPVAVMVTFYQFVLEALQTLAGVHPVPPPALFEAVSLDALRKRPGRREFVRGRVERKDGRVCVRPAGVEGAGILKSMSEADCFIVLTEEQDNIEPGTTVLVQPFHALM